MKWIFLAVISAFWLVFISALSADTGSAQLHGTIIFDLKLDGCDPAKGREIQDGLRERLGRLPYLTVVNDAGGAGCSSEKDARNAMKANGAHRAIYGSVSVKTEIKKQRMGDSGTDRYIIKSEKYETYLIRVDLVDAEKGTIAEITVEAKPGELNRVLDETVASLAVYFTRRTPAQKSQADRQPASSGEKPAPAEKAAAAPTVVVPEPEIVKNEGGDAPDAPAEPVREIREETTGKTRRSAFGAAIRFSVIVPSGDFAGIASYAFGTILEGRGKDLIAENIELRAGLGYYYLSSTENDVTSYRALVFSVSGGYRFDAVLFEHLTLTPLFGFGFQTHFLENMNYSGVRTYLDPLISVACEAEYSFTDRFAMTGAAGFSVFFESPGTGMYPEVNLGVTYAF